MEQYDVLYNEAERFLTGEKLNSFRIYEWRTLLSEADFEIEKYNELVLYFSVSAFQTNTGFSSVEPPKFVECLQKEVYNALVSDTNRGKANVLLSSAIGGIGALVATQFQMNPFVVGGFLNLILISVVKIGVDAWCRFYEEKANIKEEPSE